MIVCKMCTPQAISTSPGWNRSMTLHTGDIDLARVTLLNDLTHGRYWSRPRDIAQWPYTRAISVSPAWHCSMTLHTGDIDIARVTLLNDLTHGRYPYRPRDIAQWPYTRAILTSPGWNRSMTLHTGDIDIARVTLLDDLTPGRYQYRSDDIARWPYTPCFNNHDFHWWSCSENKRQSVAHLPGENRLQISSAHLVLWSPFPQAKDLLYATHWNLGLEAAKEPFKTNGHFKALCTQRVY